jgi:hypothetical protein
MLLASLTLDQLSNCPDADAYWDSISVLLWGHVSPVILSMSAVRTIFRILGTIFKDV